MYKPLFSESVQQKPGCLKSYIKLTSYINLIVSIIALAFGSYRAVQNKSAWSGSGQDWNTTFIVGILGGSSLLFLTSVFGICGSRKNNRCMIFFFLIFSMVLAALFLGMGVGFYSLTSSHVANISDANCTLSDSNTTFLKAQEAYNVADILLCSPSCACALNNPDVITYLKTSQGAAKLNNIDLVNGVTQVQDCPTYNAAFGNLTSQSEWIQIMEQQFTCTGMCTKPQNLNIYFFSDINEGLPRSDTCKQYFQDFVETYGIALYIIGLSVGVYLLFNALLSLCLCCKGKQQGQSYYDRLVSH